MTTPAPSGNGTENANRYRIARWLRAMLEGPQATVRPEKLSLRHVTLNDRQVDIALFPIPANDNGLDLGELAERIDEIAHDDAEGLGGLQRYVVHALLGERPMSRLPFRVAGSDLTLTGTGEDALDSEPATVQGLLAQGMRHLEVMTRLHVHGLGQLVSTDQRTIARLAEQSDRSEARRFEAVELAESMFSDKEERRLRADEAAQKLKTSDQNFAFLRDVGTAVVEKLQGTSEKHAAEILALHGAFVESLGSPERASEFLAVLPPKSKRILELILSQVPEPEAAGEPSPPAPPAPSPTGASPMTPAPSDRPPAPPPAPGPTPTNPEPPPPPRPRATAKGGR